MKNADLIAGAKRLGARLLAYMTVYAAFVIFMLNHHRHG